MKNFIIYEDFAAIATTEDLEVLSDDNTDVIQACNEIAIDEAASYLNTKYDIVRLFADPVEYSSSTAYTVDARVYTYIGTPGEIKHYTCIADAPAGTELSNTDFFTARDSRDHKLLQVVMSMSLFYIHMRLTPNNIPEFRIAAYDGNGDDNIMSAIKWLMMIQKGDLNPYNWPEKEGEDLDGDDDTIGDNPSIGMMFGNDMGESYHHYNNLTDPNKI